MRILQEYDIEIKLVNILQGKGLWKLAYNSEKYEAYNSEK